MLSKSWLVRLAAAAGCVSMFATAARAAEDSPRVEVRRLVILREGQPRLHVVRANQEEEGTRRGPQAREGSHWIGLECFPLDPALRSHLGLAEGAGLIIEHVVAESPAAKAELKQHDVIVGADGTQIKSVADLVKAVDEARENELALEIVRGGKSMTVKVTPARRPEVQEMMRRVPERRLEDFRSFFEHLQRGEQPGRYRIFGPGAVLPGADKGLPKDLSVSITRTGSEPAKITVKKGEQTWEVSEDELDKLPEEVRPHVQRMLGRGVVAMPGMPDLGDGPLG